MQEDIDILKTLEQAERDFHSNHGLWGLRAMATPPAILVGILAAAGHPLVGLVAGVVVYGIFYGGLKKITYRKVKNIEK